jgi:hypothetical protein
MSQFIGRIEHMRDMPNAEHGRQLLHRIATLAEPIMQNHGCRVGELHEFYPQQRPNRWLLGLNQDGGRRIYLLLRDPRDPHRFMSEDKIMDSMLHELTHNKYGPHGHRFHATWNMLRDEWAELRRRGWGQDNMPYGGGHGGMQGGGFDGFDDYDGFDDDGFDDFDGLDDFDDGFFWGF